MDNPSVTLTISNMPDKSDKKYPIDLGRSMPSLDSLPTGSPAAPSDKHYPTLFLEWEEDYELPESGKMTVKFKKNSETNTKVGKDKQAIQRVELEITSIESVSAGKKDKEESSGDALDKLKKKVTKKLPDDGVEEVEETVEVTEGLGY